jgi:hypothetical protein
MAYRSRCVVSAYSYRNKKQNTKCFNAVLLCGFSVRERDGSPSRAFQRAVYGASVAHEVGAGPGIGREEIIWKEIGFQPIAVRAGENDVALMVDAAMRERVNVVKRRRVNVQRSGAVDAAATTVTHGRSLDGALVACPAKGHDGAFAPPDAGETETGESDVVTVSSNGHFTSL